MRAFALLVASLLVIAAVPSAAVDGTEANEPPLVDAGLDQTVQRGTTVWLNGGGSRDPDGSAASYRWSIETPSGQTTTPRNASAVRTQFRASSGGRYAVTLTVTDDDGATQSDTLYVTVESAEPPTASVHGPSTVTAGSEARYTANVSDPDGQIRTVQWENGATGESVRRRFDSVGTTELSVTATDDDGRDATATKTVRVLPANQPPTARIEGPKRVVQGTSATFDVRASDPDGSVDRIEWSKGDSGAALTRRFDGPAGTTIRLRATVYDDSGARSTATKAVRVVEPRTTLPQIEIDGPLSVSANSTHDYRATATDPDGTGIRRLAWIDPGSVRETSTRTHTFRRPSGSTVEFTALAEDEQGQVSRETIPVRIMGKPSVSINGIPSECVRAGSTVTLTGPADDPDGSVTGFTWRVDGEAVGHTSSLTHTFRKNGTTPVTLTVTDNDGQTASVTRTVCTEASLDNHAPKLTEVSGTWFADRGLENGEEQPRNAFRGTIETQWPVVNYEATATDEDGDRLTFYWKYGDGVTGSETPDDEGNPNLRTSSISHSYDERDSNAGQKNRYTVTLIVEDEHGATTRTDRTVTVLPNPTENPRHYSLRAESQTVKAEQPVTFYVETSGRNRQSNEVTKAKIRFGDGQSKRISSNSDDMTATISHTYYNPGTYEVQLSSVLDQEKDRTTTLDDTVTIRVTRNQYSEYHYGLRERVSTVSVTSPGSEWSKGGIDHFQQRLSEVLEETAVAHSTEARKLERQGYHARKSWTESVQIGTEYVRSETNPGSDWKLDERNVDTVRKQDGWKYRTTDNRLYGTDWSLVRTVRTTEQIEQTATSASRPSGGGWRLAGSAGRQRDGWTYRWVDDYGSMPSGAVIVATDRDVVDKDVEYNCVDWQYNRNWLGNLGKECTDWDRDVDYEYDTDYRYREPDYETVWRWERTVTSYDTDFRYRKPNYNQVARNQYRKPIYEQRRYVEYWKERYETTTYYEWHRTVVRERTSLEYPSGGIEWIEEETHPCPEGELAEQACTEVA